MAKYLTASEVAEMLRAPVESVRYWRATGRGPIAIKVGRRWLYDAEDVDDWLESKRRASATNDRIGGARA